MHQGPELLCHQTAPAVPGDPTEPASERARGRVSVTLPLNSPPGFCAPKAFNVPADPHPRLADWHLPHARGPEGLFLHQPPSCLCSSHSSPECFWEGLGGEKGQGPSGGSPGPLLLSAPPLPLCGQHLGRKPHSGLCCAILDLILHVSCMININLAYFLRLFKRVEIMVLVKRKP